MSVAAMRFGSSPWDPLAQFGLQVFDLLAVLELIYARPYSGSQSGMCVAIEDSLEVLVRLVVTTRRCFAPDRTSAQRRVPWGRERNEKSGQRTSSGDCGP